MWSRSNTIAEKSAKTLTFLRMLLRTVRLLSEVFEVALSLELLLEILEVLIVDLELVFLLQVELADLELVEELLLLL